MLDRDRQQRTSAGFNRRDFLKGSGVAVAATAMATAAIEEQAVADVKPNVVPAKPTEVVLNVNGKEHRVMIEPRTSLLHCLRDDLNLTGAKDVEDGSAIGADTVLIDGKAVHSGSVLAMSCIGQKIETIESLKNGDQIDDVIAGFVKHDGLQCGYCTPGFVMATRAALNKKPNATVDELKHMLGGNICRCGTYQGILQCALEIAKKGEVATKGGA
ncbi:MAG TPA: 2Fe-2S iron-sulfur cluster-binding protein [Planctomycetaceae bacterium]|jgi:aerobic-type carbon monoxide dehydrogenase small subunit (CoxS/CutS family)|nr:2Fe-2S iron-sulfur cluster-binding protein [Planctomycetaceae bacterium]